MIELRFTERNAVLAGLGIKTCSIRRNAHGMIGETFELEGRRYQLLAVVPVTLGFAATYLFRLEGETSPEGFLEQWALAYGLRREQLSLALPVWAHLFGPAPPGVR